MLPFEIFNDVCDWVEYFKDSALDRLAASLFVNSANPRGRLMAWFTAYFDASGNSRDQRWVVASGLVGNFAQWKGVEDIWKTIHAEFQVNLPFHMAEFVSALDNPKYASQRNARADYVAIAKDRQRAMSFLYRLCVCFQVFTSCAVSSIIPMELYERIDALLELRERIPPYALAVRMCLASLHKWEDLMQITAEPVECIFEDGDLGKDELSALLVSEGFDAPIFRPKDKYAGLQAADLYAWEQFYFLRKEARQQHLPPRDTFNLVINSIPKIHIEPTEATLITVCQNKGIKPRK